MKLTCDYCGHEGEYPGEVEIRGDRCACADTEACDERDRVREEKEEAAAKSET